MRLGDSITNQINRWEGWIEDRPRPLLLCPLRLLTSLILFVLLMGTNLLALARWPFSAGVRAAQSGKTHAPGEPVPVNAPKLDELLDAELPVLVDFWAEWCGPCLLMNGVLKEVAQTLKGRIVVAKVDVVLHPGLATRYNVGGLPTLLVIKDGTEVVSAHEHHCCTDGGGLH